jgi:hypothetical protein
VNGNSSNCSFDVNYDPVPFAIISNYSPDTLCINQGTVQLPAGTPAGGVYSGTGVSGNTFDPASAGAGTFWTYYTYTNSSGCSLTDSTQITVDICLGIAAQNTASVQVYPNPTSGVFFVQAGNSNDMVKVKLMEPDGKLLQEKIYHGGKIQMDLGNLPSGIYFMEVNLNGTTSTLKVVRN